jgi:tetratricopeptide (TPR) repeat protein
MSAKEYLDLGIEHHNKLKYDEAIADYTKAIELNPNISESYNN